MTFYAKLLRYLAPVMVVGIFAARSEAVLIDDFSDVEVGTTQVASQPGFGFAANTDVGLSNVIGGIRYIDINVTASTFGGTSTATVNTFGSGTYSSSDASGNNSEALIRWSPVAANLTAGGNDRFSISVLATDLGVDLTLFADDGTTSDSVTQTINAVGIVEFLFSNFTGVDFTSIDDLSLFIDGPQDSDVTLDLVQTTGQSVPEPASIALWTLLGFAATAFAWRRCKR